MILDKEFWDNKYINNETRWDLGEVSPPLKKFIDQIENKEIKILIPGAGNAYEAEYLWKNDFRNTHIVDLSEKAINAFIERVPSFPKEQAINCNFFELDEKFDLILEQTFFCALSKNLRHEYVLKMHSLLFEGGQLVGLLFNIPLYEDHPPFGGNKSEYEILFKDFFSIHTMEIAYNSIPPRQGNELFIEFRKN